MRAAGKREAKIRTVKFVLGSADGAGLTALLVFLSVTNHFMGFGRWLTAAAVSQLVGISQDGTAWPTIAFVTFFTVLSVATFLLARWGEAREASRLPAT